jgi:hypothetical protein
MLSRVDLTYEQVSKSYCGRLSLSPFVRIQSDSLNPSVAKPTSLDFTFIRRTLSGFSAFSPQIHMP